MRQRGKKKRPSFVAPKDVGEGGPRRTTQRQRVASHHHHHHQNANAHATVNSNRTMPGPHHHGQHTLGDGLVPLINKLQDIFSQAGVENMGGEMVGVEGESGTGGGSGPNHASRCIRACARARVRALSLCVMRKGAGLTDEI